MCGKSRVSSAISVCDNLTKFHNWFFNSGGLGVGAVVTGWCKLKVRARLVTYTKFFSAIIFILVLLGLIDLSDIVTLCNRPNSCYQQTVNWLKCFDMPLLSLGLFS